MCFSPDADLAVGTIVLAVGVDALRHVRAGHQIPLASIPMLLGLHQITEAFVWWGLQGHVAHTVERIALWIYLLFALAFLPALLTIAVGLVERSPFRRRVIWVFSGVAVAVSTVLAVAMFRGSVGSAIAGHHIAYEVEALQHGGHFTALYVVATCGALLASSYRDLEILGALNFVAVPVLAWMTLNGFISLWCFWAAIVSVVFALHLRRAAKSPGREVSSLFHSP
jgi:hypothetical protein